MSKPIIETMINTAALALTSFGVSKVTNGFQAGYLAVAVGFGLEFIKYFGRKKKLW